jgi:ferritin-like metal-binding protein YciE
LKEVEHGLVLEGYKHHGRSFRPYAAGHLLRGTGDSESEADLEKATNPDLRSGLQQHLAETRNHVHRVEQVFQMHGVERETVNSPAVDGIIEEADEIANDVDNKEVLDAALIAAAQAVEHYEITRYGALVSWAQQLGRSECASVLHHNLEEEKAAGQNFTQIAEAKVNLEAAQ